LGWVDAGYVNEKEPRQPTEQRVYEKLTDILNANLSSVALQHLYQEGSAWSEDQAAIFVEKRTVSIDFLPKGVHVLPQ